MIKIIEFKFTPDRISEGKIEAWFTGLRYFWNYALEQMIILDDNYWFDKDSKQMVERSQVPWSWTKSGDDWVPCSQLLHNNHAAKNAPSVRLFTTDRYKNHQNNYVYTVPQLSKVWGWQNGYGYACPISCHQPSLIRSFALKNSKIGLGLLNRGDTIKECDRPNHIKEAILGVPYKYRAGTLESLSVSWQEYLKTRSGVAALAREKPKFKGIRDPITTIIHPNPNAGDSQPRSKDAVRTDGDYLTIPGLGQFKIHGLANRWIDKDGTIPRIKVFKIVKKASGYYIQLTGEFQQSRRINRNRTAIAADFGLKEDNWISLSDGTQVPSPRWYRKYEEKISRIQKQINEKITKRLILWLNHPLVSIKDANKVVSSLTLEQFEAIKNCRDPECLQRLISEEVITNSQFNRLLYNAVFPGEDQPLCKSNQILKLKRSLSKTHEKIKRARNAYHHYHSSRLIRRHDIIVLEDGLQNSRGKSKAKIEDGEFKKNGRSANKGKNKSLSDAAIGGFIEKVKSKGKETETPVYTRHGAYSSQQCPKCDHVLREQKDITNHPDYYCPNCGYRNCDRDVKAGLTLLLWQYLDGGIDYYKLPSELRDICLDLSEKEKKARLKNILAMRKSAREGGCEKGEKKEKAKKPDQVRRSGGKKKKAIAHRPETCFQLKLPL